MKIIFEVKKDVSKANLAKMHQALEDNGFDAKVTEQGVEVVSSQDELLSISESIDNFYELIDNQ